MRVHAFFKKINAAAHLIPPNFADRCKIRNVEEASIMPRDELCLKGCSAREKLLHRHDHLYSKIHQKVHTPENIVTTTTPKYSCKLMPHKFQVICAHKRGAILKGLNTTRYFTESSKTPPPTRYCTRANDTGRQATPPPPERTRKTRIYSS